MKLDKKKINKMNILVIGDIAIDKYIFGSVERLSPEGPIPILNVERTEKRLGMAANVALNLKSLGAKVTLCSDINKEDAEWLVPKLLENNLKLATFSTDRPTIYKNRLVANNQILYRFDKETITNLAADEEQRLIAWATTDFPSYDAVVISDYGKGFFSEKLAATLVSICKINNVPCLVDPDVNKFIHTYLDATVVKPNQKELGKWGITLDEFRTSYLNTFCDHLVVTVGNKGMLCKSDATGRLIEARIDSKTFVDVSGAGDTALAVLTLCNVLGFTIKDSMKVANVGAGLVANKMGTAQITLDELNKLL